MTVFDDYLQSYYAHEAYVMLNNMPFPSLKNILELNSDNIRSIEMKNQKFFYDNYLMYGIVSIKTGKPVVVEPYYSYCKAAVEVMPEIIETPAVKEGYGGTLPDVRHSLYWRTGQTSLAELAGIRFITSDIRGSYRLKIYSVTADGKRRMAEKVFTVL